MSWLHALHGHFYTLISPLSVAELGAVSQNYGKTTLAKWIGGFAKTEENNVFQTEVFIALMLEY